MKKISSGDISFISSQTDKENVWISDINDSSKWESNFLRTILETMPKPVFYEDSQGKYIDCNKAFEKLVGLTRGEIISKNVYEIGPKKMADKYSEKDKELYQEPGKQRYKGQVKTKDGDIRDVIFDKATITDTNGKVEGIIGVISDIMEQKNAKQDVRRQESMLDLILDALTYPFIVIDANDHTIKLANSFARSRYNISLNSKCYEAIHGLCEPCCGPKHPCPLNDIKQTGKSTKLEHLHIDSNGSPMHLEINAYPIFDEAGNLESIIEYSIDTTERTQIIDDLQKSCEQFKLAVNGSQDGIWDWDLRCNSLYLSPRWKKMIGYEDSDLPNEISTFEERIHPDDKKQYHEHLNKYLNGDIPTYRIEFRFLHKDGSYIWILAKGEALRDEHGTIY